MHHWGTLKNKIGSYKSTNKQIDNVAKGSRGLVLNFAGYLPQSRELNEAVMRRVN